MTRHHQAGEIWKVLTRQRLAECLELIPQQEDEVEEDEEGSLEFGPPPGIDGDRAGLADLPADQAENTLAGIDCGAVIPSDMSGVDVF